jgi:hypothetical protein
MPRFEAVLRRADTALDLPPQMRARILVELSNDLEALCDAYRSRGLPEQEAVARAAAALGVDSAAADELTRLHQPPYQRWTARLTAAGRVRAERILVTVLFLIVVGTGALGFSDMAMLTDTGVLSRLLLVLGVVVAGIGMSLFIRLFLAQESRYARLQLRVVGWIAAMAPLIAVVAILLELDGMLGAVATADAWTIGTVIPGVKRAAQAASIGMTVGLSAFLAWFHLRRRCDAIMRAEAELAAVANEPKGGQR